jgi:hypothetical protein
MRGRRTRERQAIRQMFNPDLQTSRPTTTLTIQPTTKQRTVLRDLPLPTDEGSREWEWEAEKEPTEG